MKQLKMKCLVSVIVLFVYLLFPLFVSAQKKKVACVGDSITYGLGLSNPSGESYPGQMQVSLGTTNWQVGNFGDSGRLLQKYGYSYWDSLAYGQALGYNPDQVVIGLGTNDAYPWALDNRNAIFKGDYKALIQSFQDLSIKPEVYICLIAPAENSGGGLYNSYIDKVNVNIKEVALEKGVALIDLHTAFDGHWPAWFQTDAVHPSITGAEEIAKQVKEMLLMTKPTVTFANGKVTSPDGDAYQWYKDGVPVVAGDGGNLKDFPVTKTGVYKVSIKLIANNETRIISNELNVSSLKLNELNYKRGIKVYPNPASKRIQVKIDNFEKKETYAIADLSGRVALRGEIYNGQKEIDIEQLSVGTYILAIGNEYKKIIKR